jgi:hypothetical protein
MSSNIAEIAVEAPLTSNPAGTSLPCPDRLGIGGTSDRVRAILLAMCPIRTLVLADTFVQ